MQTAVDVLSVLLPACYALAAADSIVAFVGRSEGARHFLRPLVIVALGAHLLYLGLWAAVAHRCPLGTVFEAMGIMAFSIVAVYLAVEIRGGSRPTGILILPLAFVMVLPAVAFRWREGPANPHLSDPWFSLHTLAGVLGTAALTVSFVHGVFYLLLYREIKAHRFGRLFRRLPPLAVLHRKTHTAAVVGWAFLAVTIAAGYVWAARHDALETLPADPMFLLVVAAWLLYSGGLGVRFLGGWRGRYTVFLSVGGFTVLLVALVIVAFFFPSLHVHR